MGCKSASISNDRDERAETIREAMASSKAMAAVVEPVNEKMNGISPETIIKRAITDEPITPPKP
jgi:Ethanolamine utilization protein EutJ (predicted chaperonin)